MGRLEEQHGFTLIEVLVSMLLLVVGLLGVALLIENADRTTGSNLAKEQGTTLARDVLERSRAVTYRTLGGPGAAALLRPTAGEESTAPVATTGWTTRRRGVDYTVQVAACKIDNPADGNTRITADYCNTGPNPGPINDRDPVNPGPTFAGLRFYGVAVATNGTAYGSVCALLGGSPTIQDATGALSSSRMQELVGGGADVHVCPGGATRIALDDDPDDLTRVTTVVSWTAGGTPRSTRQTTLVPNPAL